jgi:hypothetical protein
MADLLLHILLDLLTYDAVQTFRSRRTVQKQQQWHNGENRVNLEVFANNFGYFYIYSA